MSRLTQNILYNLLGQIIILLLGFVSVKYIYKQLGEEILGIIYFTYTMDAFLSAIFSLGIAKTTTREVAAHFETNLKYVQDLIRTFSLFYWSISIVVGAIIYLIAPILVHKWIHLKTVEPETAIYILRVLGISCFAAFPQALYGSLFSGLQWMGLTNFMGIAIKSVQQLGTILILWQNGDVFSVVHWHAFCFVAPVLIYMILTGKVFAFSSLVPGFKKDVVSKNWRFSLKMMLISLLATIHTQFDKLIISKFMPVGLLGYYTFAYSNASRGNFITSAVTGAAYPHLAKISSKNDHEMLLSHYWKLHDFVCLISVPIFAGILFALIPIYSYIFDPDISKMLFWPSLFLCLGFYMNTTLHIPQYLSFAIGKPEIIVRLNFYALFTVLPFTIILIYYLGILGAGISWVVYHIFAYSYFVPLVCSQCLKIPVSSWYKHIGKIFFLKLATYILSLTWLYFSVSFSIMNIILSYFISTFFFILCGGVLIRKELKETIIGYFRIISKIKIV
jgi:O-antigen/teichoic acid export membrane protein